MGESGTQPCARASVRWFSGTFSRKLARYASSPIVSAIASKRALAETIAALIQLDGAYTLETFSPADYLEQIRKLAYQLWETAENQQRSALEFWLAAEIRLMDSLAAGGTATDSSPGAHSPVGTSTS